MKKTLLLMVLLLMPLAFALPDNYNDPFLVANASVNADITSFAESDGIVNGHTAGSDILFGYKAVGNNLIVSSENGTTLKSEPMGFGSGNLIYHNLEEKIYNCGSSVEAWRVNNPLAPFLNGTFYPTTTGKCTLWDEENDALFIGQTANSYSVDHSNTGGWSNDTVPADMIVDKVTLETQTYYTGGYCDGSGDYFIIVDDDYNLITNTSAASGIDCAMLGFDFDQYFFIIDKDYAILAYNDGTGSKLVSLNDFTDWSVLSIGCDPSFIPLDAYGRDYIIGIDIDTDTFAVCNTSAVTGITLEDTGISIGYDETSVSNPDIWVQGDGWVFLGPNKEMLWNLQSQAAEDEGAAAGGGTPPVYRANFLGVDDDLENFVFEIRMQDADGGNLFYAIDLNTGGTLVNQTVNNNIEFDREENLDYVYTDGCPSGGYHINYESPYYPFGNDGVLFINHSGCVPTYAEFPTPADPADAEGNITGFLGLGWNTTEISGNFNTGIALYTSDGKLIDLIEFYYNFTGGNFSVVDRAGTVQGSQTSFTFDGPGGRVVIESDMDFSANKVRHTIKNSFGTIATYTNTFVTAGAIDFAEYAFDAISTADLYTVVDYIDYSYTIESAAGFPPYRTFGFVSPDSPVSKAHYEPISNFGDYEILLYGTDSQNGLEYYEEPYFLSFTYNTDTAVLSQADINSIIAAGGGAVEGDWATDLIPSMLESLGATTAASKMIIGFIILVAIAFIVADFGAIVATLTMGTAFIVLAMIGFFPIWMVTVMIIIAAVLIAVSFRSLITGGGGG